MQMNTYTASYFRTGKYGSYEDHQAVIVAETESEALGFALIHYPATDAKYWSIYEVPPQKGVTHILSTEN
jgi:hypothetical protein